MSDDLAAGPGTMAWFHCFAGIAGDMALGSLLDAGAPFDEVCELLERLPVGGWSLDTEPATRGDLVATRAVVKAEDDVVVRTHSHIVGLVEEARLPSRVRDRALATFAVLAEVEGRLHGRPPAQVHFHEVGGIDAIVDVVGTCAALEILEVDTVTSSPVAHGMGMVRSAHGMLPNPPPAVVELLKDAPSYGRDLPYELTTPTGAALLAALVGADGWGPMPPMTVSSSGFGAGSRDLDALPNVTQVVLGAPVKMTAGTGQPVVLIEANLDDATGETLAYAVSALLDAGARDAWITPIVMKKGRPAHVVSALADPALAEQVMATLRAETGSLGVRTQELRRHPSGRAIVQVDVDGFPMRVKVSPGRVKVEHDDAARMARERGVPLRDAVRRAEEAWHLKGDDTGADTGDETDA
ncbi:MAG TPA: nickel pincer cofactor biosynthesis protein LarC [Acidimicrobiales bacterium]|nr:nickel pincer cofactor biosynthesis protein LarC [Acidimicrobiales bacterium]